MTRPLLALMIALTAGCSLGPDYQAPSVPVPAEFKSAPGWIQASSSQLQANAWWESYQDPILNELALKLGANQDLHAAEARFRQAQSLLRASRAALWPELAGQVGVSRTGQGEGAVQTGYELGGAVSWELDLWGRIRRTLEASDAEAQASQADLQAVRLSLQSSLVQSYLELRLVEAEKRLLEKTVAAYRRALTLTQNQFSAGMVPKSDVTQAQTQLKSAESELLALSWQRSQYENAIAVLLGQAPQSFTVKTSEKLPALPVTTVGVPSSLLLMRPDIARQERLVKAANAQIGVAQSAWLPDLTLSANAGYSGTHLADWLSAPNRFWSLGPRFALRLFDGGKRRAELEQVEAQYDQTVAQYRQSVLNALREVEDSLVQANGLAAQRKVQLQALKAAQQSLALINNQYRAGMVDYNAVVNVQTQALTQERKALTLRGQELLSHAQLITALGGVEPPSAFLDAKQ